MSWTPSVLTTLWPWFLCLVLVWPGGSHAAEGLAVGIAKTEITPPVGTPLAGYGRYYGQPARGVQDPLYARALALTHAGQTVVVVSCDLVLIDGPLRHAVLTTIRRAQPLREDALILVATHTHTGAGALGSRLWERLIMGLFDPQIFTQVTDRIAQAALMALRHPIGVTAAVGQTRIDALVANRMDAQLALPQSLKVLQFQAPSGRIVGRLVFMAAHPTLAPWQCREFSADYPGVLTQALEQHDPGSVAVFVQGAAGDLAPQTAAGPAPHARSTIYGLALADVVLHLAFTPVALDGPWSGELVEMPLPPVQLRVGFVHVPSWVGNRLLPRRTVLQVVRLGPLLFLALPGEWASETGQELEQLIASEGWRPFLFGYANDYIGYVIPRRYYGQHTLYEARVSLYGSHLAAYLQQQVRHLLSHLGLTAPHVSYVTPRGVSDKRLASPVEG